MRRLDVAASFNSQLRTDGVPKPNMVEMTKPTLIINCSKSLYLRVVVQNGRGW